jgi:hypothetical protein
MVDVFPGAANRREPREILSQLYLKRPIWSMIIVS